MFDESGQARDPAGNSPAVSEAQHRLLSWGLQVDLTEGSEMGLSLSQSSPDVVHPRCSCGTALGH